MSWQDAAKTAEYRAALQATTSLTKDNQPIGFVKPHEFDINRSDTNIQRQNNTLIYLLVQALEELKELKAIVQALDRRVSSFEAKLHDKETPQLPEDVVDQLSRQFVAVNLGTETSKANKQKHKGQFLT
ncbi:hypothetical protein ACLOJK_003324 [Asimina triloba]